MGRFSRNNVLAGSFLIGSVALAVWVSFMLKARSLYASSTPFVVRFSVSQGATGIKQGSPVLLGGQQVGSVRAVAFQKSGPEASALARNIDVRVEVRSDIAVYENAMVFLELPLLGTLSSINISDVGDPAKIDKPQGATPRLESGDVVLGQVAPPGFLAQAGFGPDQVEQLRVAMKSFSTTVSKVSEIVDRSGPKVESSLEDLRALASQVRTNLETWGKKLDSILANTETASGKLDPLLAKAEQTVADASATFKDVRALITDNREKIDAIIANSESITRKFDQKTIDELNAALAVGRDALASVSSSTDRFAALVSSETPNFRRILANLRLMSDQLKLTAVEVRSQPWRLLVQPTTKEFESQVLYDATRAYATAASDLRSASESLDAAIAASSSPAATPSDRESVVELSARLKEAFAGYQKAEQGLLDKLIEQQK